VPLYQNSRSKRFARGWILREQSRIRFSPSVSERGFAEGPLAGLEGILVRKKNNLRMVLTFEALMRSIALEIAISDLEPAGERQWPATVTVTTASAFA
jgi:hypothetical protein